MNRRPSWELRGQGTWVPCIALALLAVCAAPVRGQVWSGGGADYNWSTPANWVGGVVPVSGTPDLRIELGGTVLTSSLQDLASPFSLAQLVIADTALNGFSVTGDRLFFEGSLLSERIHVDTADSVFFSNEIDWADTLTISSTRNSTACFQGTLTGGSLRVEGPAGVFLDGSEPNTFSGSTFIAAGASLATDKPAGITAIPGDVVIAGSLSQTRDNHLSAAARVEIVGGSLRLNSTFQSAGRLVMDGGRVSSTSFGRLTVNDSIESLANASTTSTISSPLSFDDESRVIRIADGAVVNGLAICGPILNGRVIKEGPGTTAIASDLPAVLQAA